MKVSLGMHLQPGPWGGGNQFGRALADFLVRKGVAVSFDLHDRDIDVIILAEPRANLKISAYTDREIFKYLGKVNEKAIVVHRVNECDERKQTQGVNKRLMLANRCADATVFVSVWLKDLLVEQGMRPSRPYVILNGCNRSLFHAQGYQRWDRHGPLKIVTHHWGGGLLKGFDIYQRLDQLLATDRYRGRIEFTFVGNVPPGFRFVNAAHVSPLYGDALASEIRRHHVYLTASQHEPGGHHQNEGASCGLPLLFRESGCLPEYCQGFGLSFTVDNFEEQLQAMMEFYEHWVSRMDQYPHTAERMGERYYNLFVNLLAQRDEIIRTRQRWRWPMWVLSTMSA